jgi:hypothetical protein
LDVKPFSLQNSVSTFRRNQLTPSSWQNSNTVRRGSRFSVMFIPTTNLHDVTFETTLIFRKKNSCSWQQPVFRGLLTYSCIYCRCYCVYVCVFYFYLQYAPLHFVILHACRDHCIQYLHLFSSSLSSVAVRILS